MPLSEGKCNRLSSKYSTHLSKEQINGIMRKNYLKLAVLLLTCLSGMVQAQTWGETDKVVSTDRQSTGYFSGYPIGSGVSICNDYAAVAAESEDYLGYTAPGRVYIFKKAGNCNWELQQVIQNPEPNSQDFFGKSVALSYDYLAIGAPNENYDASGANGMTQAGAVYIYRNVSGVWTFDEKIVASDREVGAFFGSDVSTIGGYLVVGAPGEDGGPGVPTITDAGAAYVFQPTASGWTEWDKLVASDRAEYDGFGGSVSIYRTHVIVGARNEDEDVNGNNTISLSGSAYFFEWDGISWPEIQKVTSTDRGFSEYFGNDVSVYMDYAVVGCYADDQDENGTNYLSGAGSAFVYKWNYSTQSWDFNQKIVRENREEGDLFGASVSVYDSRILVGAYLADGVDAQGNSIPNTGAAYLFETNGSTWTQEQEIVPAIRDYGDWFGRSVAIWNDDVIVGAMNEDHDDATPPGNYVNNAGAAYFFEPDIVAAPPTVTASSTTVCSGGQVVLTASGNLGNSSDWQWYEGVCNSVPIGTGASVTVSPTTTTTYYVNAIGGCNALSTGVCSSITITTTGSSWQQTTEDASGGDVTYDVITDAENNVYVTGSFIGQTIINGGGASDYVASTVAGESGSYVAKYNSCGDLEWVAHATSSQDNYGRSIVLDEENDVVYTAGEYTGDFMLMSSGGCSSGALGTSGVSRGYVAAFDMSTGCIISLDQVVSNTYTTLEAITVNESSGDIFVGGKTSPNSSGAIYTSFIYKYSPTTSGIGSLVASITSNNYNHYENEVRDMDFDESNHRLWVIGNFEGEMYFSPGVGTISVMSSSVVQDAYLLAYEDAGSSFSPVYNQAGKATYYMTGEGIAVDPNTGEPYMTGTFFEEVDTPFGFSTINSLPSLTGNAAYCATYDLSSGGWANYYNVEDSDANGMSVAHDGTYSYFAGTFNRGDVYVQTLGYYPYAVSGTAQQNNHTIIVSFDENGSGIWANVTTDPYSNSSVHDAKSITTNDYGNVFVVGAYLEYMDYYFTYGTAPLASTGSGTNGYILRGVKNDGSMYKTGDREDTPVEVAKTSTQYTVYPNPTNSALTLQIDNYNSEATYKGMLMNAMGQVVRSETITASTTVLDLSGFPAGIYFLVINDGTQSQTVRISKTN